MRGSKPKAAKSLTRAFESRKRWFTGHETKVGKAAVAVDRSDQMSDRNWPLAGGHTYRKEQALGSASSVFGSGSGCIHNDKAGQIFDGGRFGSSMALAIREGPTAGASRHLLKWKFMTPVRAALRAYNLRLTYTVRAAGLL